MGDRHESHRHVGCSRHTAAGRSSVEAEDGQKALVDSPHLLGRCHPNLLAQTYDVDSAELLDENSRDLVLDLNLGSKARLSRALGGWGDENDRARQKRIELDDHAEPSTLLLVPGRPRWTQLIDLTPPHEGSP